MLPIAGDLIRLLGPLLQAIMAAFASPGRRYDQACRIARRRAAEDVARLRAGLAKEKAAMLPHGTCRGLAAREKAIDRVEMERYEYHLNNILRLYRLKDRQTRDRAVRPADHDRRRSYR